MFLALYKFQPTLLLLALRLAGSQISQKMVDSRPAQAPRRSVRPATGPTPFLADSLRDSNQLCACSARDSPTLRRPWPGYAESAWPAFDFRASLPRGCAARATTTRANVRSGHATGPAEGGEQRARAERVSAAGEPSASWPESALVGGHGHHGESEISLHHPRARDDGCGNREGGPVLPPATEPRAPKHACPPRHENLRIL